MNLPELTVDQTADELIQLRFAALEKQDFSLFYASYHPRAPFIELFPHTDVYLEFAVQNLSGIRFCESLVGISRSTPEGVEQISSMRFEIDGVSQTLYELALLVPTDDGWRYHSAQKLSDEEYQGEFAALDFVHFEKQSPIIRF